MWDEISDPIRREGIFGFRSACRTYLHKIINGAFHGNHTKVQVQSGRSRGDGAVLGYESAVQDLDLFIEPDVLRTFRHQFKCPGGPWTALGLRLHDVNVPVELPRAVDDSPGAESPSVTLS